MLRGQLVSFDNEYYVYTRCLGQFDQYEFIKVQEDNSKPEIKILSDLSKVEQIELQPGDEVRICMNNTNFLDLCYTPTMGKHEGETTKILRDATDGILKNYKTYLLECTESEYYWTANWFIPIKKFNNNNECDNLLDRIYDILQ